MTEDAQIKEPEKKVADQDSKAQPQLAPTQQAQSTETSPSSSETPEQINWRKFRQEREKERKEKMEADRRAAEKEAEAAALKAAMEALIDKPSRAQQNVVTDNNHGDFEESEEQRVARLVKDEMDKERKNDHIARQQREAAEVPQRLNQAYNDFQSVCTTENLDYLEYHYPEVAAAFKHMPDSFDKWANIYKAVKRFVPNNDHKKDLAKMEKNLAKPQSMSNPGMTQTGDHAPTDLTDKRRQDNWARMQRTLKGVR